MKARIVGMSSWQGTPSSGTLTVWPDERYEDGNGNATPGRLDYVLDVESKTWRERHNPAADAYLVVRGADEAGAVTAMFDEAFEYPDRPTVRQHFRRALVASDLDATQFNYVAAQDVWRGTGLEPLTMEAARKLLRDGPPLLIAHELALAEARAAAERIGATGLVYLGDNPDGSVALAVFSPAAVTYSPQSIPFAGVLDVPTLEIP